MIFKKVSIFIFLLLSLIIFTPAAIGQQIQPPGRELKIFRDLLSIINATFIVPDGFNEVKPVANDKFACNYALKIPDVDFEARFQVNSIKAEWKNFEKGKGDRINPDSLYTKIATTEVKGLAGDNRFFSRGIPQSILQEYKADLGRSYFFSLADSPETNPSHYQYGLLVVLQKNHYGNICVACFSNERGPGFFKNINKLKDCLRFTN
jgi:hypothetical protein